MLPFQTLKNEIDRKLLARKAEDELHTKYIVGHQAVVAINKKLSGFMDEFIEFMVLYTKHAKRKVIKERDVELAWYSFTGRKY